LCTKPKEAASLVTERISVSLAKDFKKIDKFETSATKLRISSSRVQIAFSLQKQTLNSDCLVVALNYFSNNDMFLGEDLDSGICTTYLLFFIVIRFVSQIKISDTDWPNVIPIFIMFCIST
jgi:transcription elongation factor GreA-like protein